MAQKRTGDTVEVEKLLAEQMPGWRVVPARNRADNLADNLVAPASPGPSIDVLKRKYLGAPIAREHHSDQALPDVQVDAGQEDPPDKAQLVFRIEPVDGGPVRVAELKRGRVVVVSG